MADGILAGKRGLVMGVANDHSIAWGIAQAMHAAGAELAFTHQGDAFGSRVRPLAASVGARLILDVDVASESSLNTAFAALRAQWSTLDFVVHSIAFADKAELAGRFMHTSRGNFLKALEISAYSFIDVARRAHPMMLPGGGSLMTLTYLGSTRVVPNYNVMGVAKAALEAATRYLANDLGPEGIRVNAISPGPMRTLAGAAVGGARRTFRHAARNAPLRVNGSLEAVGGTAVWLASDASSCTTGELIHVDGGYHVLGMPQPDTI